MVDVMKRIIGLVQAVGLHTQRQRLSSTWVYATVLLDEEVEWRLFGHPEKTRQVAAWYDTRRFPIKVGGYITVMCVGEYYHVYDQYYKPSRAGWQVEEEEYNMALEDWKDQTRAAYEEWAHAVEAGRFTQQYVSGLRETHKKLSASKPVPPFLPYQVWKDRQMKEELLRERCAY